MRALMQPDLELLSAGDAAADFTFQMSRGRFIESYNLDVTYKWMAL